jgi:hypothetical protein
MSTMQCPHGCVACTTCEDSAAAKELRALRNIVEEVDALDIAKKRDSVGRPGKHDRAWMQIRTAIARWRDAHQVSNVQGDK